MADGRTYCNFLWLIENYSYCWHENGKKLVSPEFTADGFDGNVWTLELYPRGEFQEGYISFYLNRCQGYDCRRDFSVMYELSVLAADGLSLRCYNEHSFIRGIGYGCGEFVHRNEILLHGKTAFLPQDTLSVRCKIWWGKGKVRETKEITARTRIGIEEISFLHLIENFSKMKPDEKKTIQIKTPAKRLTSCLYFIEDSSEGTIGLEITPSDENRILAKCKISLLDTSGEKTECVQSDNRFDHTRKDIQNLPLSITRQKILNKKSNYLPEDNLSLSCECVFSTGVEYTKIERMLCKKPSNVYYQIISNVPTKGICGAQSEGIYNAAERLSAYASTMANLKVIYDNQWMLMASDVELTTETKTFPAHKVLLCARSPVFKTMLSSDMKEKNSNIILIDDLEDDTVQQLLTFLYTDRLEDLCWDSAMELYYTGDKYQIEGLKVICSSYLVENVGVSSASELLVLADTHSDSDLKKAVEDFILKHEEQVFGSEEWYKLTETNSELAVKTMLLKYNKK